MASKRGRSIYSSGLWRKVRVQVLERDGYRCKIAGARCTSVADQVDHIVPLSRGGAPYDPANLRAACKACNVARGNYRGENWRYAETRIVLVIGPPLAGKTAYVAEHAAPGDLRVDYDHLAAAIGGKQGANDMHEAVRAARNALLRSIRRGEAGAARAWIVSANPDAEQLFPHHEVVLVDPGIDECLARVGGRGAGVPPGTRDRVRAWYQQRSSSDDRSLRSRDW